ncbi:MAG: sulfatase-like hydrolase/transferase, partial [Pseudomonadota bacterium]
IDAWQATHKAVDTTLSTACIDSNIPQLGTALSSRGYETGHFGKWHVGLSKAECRPLALGWTHWTYHGNAPGTLPTTKTGDKLIYDPVTPEGRVEHVDFLDSYFADRAIEFITNARAEDKPFFLNFWPVTPHFRYDAPLDLSPGKLEQFNNLATDRDKINAMVNRVDDDIARIIDALGDDLANTLILVTSDNGAANTALPDGGSFALPRGHKSTPY